MLKKYFRLFEECYLVNGLNDGALYNLLTGYIYNMDNSKFKILCLLEQNYSVREVIQKCNISDEEMVNILKDVEDASLGKFYDKKIYIEKLTKDPKWVEYLFFTPPPYLKRAFIELDNNCNNNCFFCANDDYIRRNMCIGCNKYEIRGNTLTENDFSQVLEQLKKLQCQEIYFTGGDVFINWEENSKIIRKAYDLHFENINIIWGGEDIPQFILMTLKKLNITLIIQKYVENSIDLTQYDFIKNLNLNIGFILLSKYENKNKLASISEKINLNLNCKFIFHDILLRMDDKNRAEYMREINEIPLVKADEFFNKKKSNSCLNATISITADGYITPCFGLRNYKVGEIHNLLEIFYSKKMNEFWELSKEKIDGCNSCQFRYACNDCRSIEMKLGSSLRDMESCERLKQNYID